MTLWEKTKPSDLVVGFLDLSLLAFLIFDFGYKNFTDFHLYKLIVLPALLLALIAFNSYNYYVHHKKKALNQDGRISFFEIDYEYLVSKIKVAPIYWFQPLRNEKWLDSRNPIWYSNVPIYLPYLERIPR